MNIECLVLGQLGVNCYLLTDNGEAVVIDPGAQCELILKSIEQSGCVLKKILLTHGHFDHIGAVSELAQKTDAPVYIHSKDAKMLVDNNTNLSFMTGEQIPPYEADEFLDNIEEIPFGKTHQRVYYTPGHSYGSVSFLVGDCLFCGDLLFRGSIGRYDFGDLNTELNSIKYLIEMLPEGTNVYPGHGSFTTIGYERSFNPYIVNDVLE